ncbi:MAG: dimethyladenosine transferase, rRNA (adenine1518-N6/adenine1519-N6)-dimethyltransferase [Candidatus Parcubacteria bacterium]|jgi:16S rRNA (adenine1518-N6/adenine1519-N6)-dimethyltransferase
MVYAKKSLGQHFLTSEKALRTMVRSANLTPGEIVLEIGPGKGALTLPLLEAGAHVIAIEKDNDMVSVLEKTALQWIQRGALTLVSGDIRALDSDTLEALVPKKHYKVIANIPYYITGEIIRQFLTIEPQPTSMTLLIQKEVAERIARDTKESILSLSVKVYGTPRYIETVPAGAFSPPPSVDSAILHIQNITKSTFEHVDEHSFFRAVKCGFASRRKQLRGNLRIQYEDAKIAEAFRSCNLRQDIRAEDVSCEQWITIATILNS